jgi:hypothetical protein
MMGRRLTPKGLSAARFEQEVFNSQIKRGEIDPNDDVREEYVVCGCGVEGCGFMTRWLKSDPWNVDLKAEHERYNRWLEQQANEQKTESFRKMGVE